MIRNKTKLKPYVSHMLPITAIRSDTFDLPMEQNAVISCADSVNRYLDSGEILYKLIIPFPDVDNKRITGAFDVRHAKTIMQFLCDLPETVTDLYVCCSEGISRSTALAAALLKASKRSDREVWNNSFYAPNALVYNRMCRELGIFMPGFLVSLKKAVNKTQYRKAKKKGTVGKYERWKIIF